MTTGRDTFEGWMPVSYGDEAIQQLQLDSAMERLARPEPMPENTKNIPRITGFQVGNVAKGELYQLSQSDKDRIELSARKVGGMGKIANEDLRDPQADVLAAIRKEAATALATNLDNSCIGVSAAPNSTTVKFTSIYRLIRSAPTADSFDDVLGYAADDNYEALSVAEMTAAMDAATNAYDTLSDLLERFETGRFFSDADTVVIAHPSFRGYLRKVKDSNGNPALVQTGTNAMGRPIYSIFGYGVEWSYGAKTSAVDTQEPDGNPLMVMGNRQLMRLGKRALQPDIPADTFGWAIQPSSFGDGFDSDETKVKAAYRRAFALCTALGAVVLEVTP